MTRIWTRQIAAALLIACLGLSVPAVAGSMHLCLRSWLVCQPVDTPDCCNSCCDACDPDDHGSLPCCIDLEQLPDATVPASPMSSPDVPVFHLEWTQAQPLLDIPLATVASHQPIRMIRGPCRHPSRQAVFEIWRL